MQNQKTSNRIRIDHVCYDDASVDATGDMLTEADIQFENVTSIRARSRLGAAFARYAAIHAANPQPSDIVALLDLDGDTFFDDDTLLRVVDEYDKGADMTYGSFVERSETGEIDESPLLLPSYAGIETKRDLRELPFRCYPLRTFRYSLLSGYGLDSFRLPTGKYTTVVTDVPMMLHVMQQAKKMRRIVDATYIYQKHDQNEILVEDARKREQAERWFRYQKWPGSLS